jgi:Gas vesicle synthesis protein GvpL/GvpF
MSRVYVYALVEQRARRFRAGASTVSVIDCGTVPSAIDGLPLRSTKIYAAVERREDAPVLSEAALTRQHQIVATLAHRVDAILPVRFGSLIEHDELLRIVQLRGHLLARALARVRGHEQMTVRVFGASKPDNRLSGPVSGATYLERRRAAQHGSLSGVADLIRSTVAPLVARESMEQGRPHVKATVHHLIPRGRSAEYVELVQDAASEAASLDRVTVSGPFAPFAFAPDIWS